MAYSATAITEFKSGSTPSTGTLASGTLFEAEFDQLYGNWQHFFGMSGVLVADQIHGTYHVSTQAQFNAIIEEVSGNQWQFIDAVQSVVFDYLAGGYQMDDDDDYLETNNCVSIKMKGGAFFDFNDGIGYLKVNTDKCYLMNVDVQGNGSSGAVVQSYLLAASYVTFDNCKCSNRLSSTDMYGFKASGTTLHNITSKYINCSVYSLSSADKLIGFDRCYNLQNCLVYDLDSTPGSDDCIGLNYCYNVSNCYIYTLVSSANVYGIYHGGNFNNCTILTLDADAVALGMADCDQVSSCYIEDITSSAGAAYGMNGCNYVSACYIYNIDSGGSADAYGIYNSDYLSACKVAAIDADSGDAYGYNDCDYLSACSAIDIDSASGSAEGFTNCTYGAALYTSETCSGNTFINAGADEYSCAAGLTP